MRRQRKGTVWFGAAVVFVAVAGLFGAVFLPPVLVSLTSDPAGLTPSQWADQISQARQVVLLAAGGLIGLLTLVVTFRRDQLSRRAHDLQVDANFTDRYTRAIDQLGNISSIAVRLGGIAALNRLAQESPRDFATIVDLLSRWVRSRPAPDSQEANADLGRYDVRSAIDTLTELVRREDRVAQISLSGADLRGVPLQDADLRSLDLTRTDLRGTDLQRADLVGASLSSANLEGSDLSDALLDGVTAQWASLRSARLRRASLVLAHLDHTDLTAADLRESMLAGIDLSESNLEGAQLVAADLTGATLYGTRLHGADLAIATMTGATLSGIHHDSSTRWPEDFTPPPSA